MLITGVVNLRSNLRQYLAQVKKGEAVVVTERGEPVARIIPEKSSHVRLEGRLARLTQAGAVIMPVRTRCIRPRKPLALKGKPLSEIVVEDRR